MDKITGDVLSHYFPALNGWHFYSWDTVKHIIKIFDDGCITLGIRHDKPLETYVLYFYLDFDTRNPSLICHLGFETFQELADTASTIVAFIMLQDSFDPDFLGQSIKDLLK